MTTGELFDPQELDRCMLPEGAHQTWCPPAHFPLLEDARRISVDLETCDPDLKTRGPGVRRGAYIAGVAIGSDDGFRGYYPIRHAEGQNLPEETVLDWLREILSRPSQEKVGANLLYDLDFLSAVGIEVQGPCLDVQFAEPLLDENLQGGYNLDSIAGRYLEEGKVGMEAIEQACLLRKLPGTARANLWQLPPSLVGPYAEGDADLPLRILPLQEERLREQGLTDLFRMECDLIPLLLQMRRTGVRINVPALEALITTMRARVQEAQERLDEIAGERVNVWEASSIAKVFDARGHQYPRTPKTDKPSFRKAWLEASAARGTKVSKAIVEVRKIDRFVGTFLRGAILDQVIDGRIHCEFHPLKSDEYGTVAGRFSSSNSNLQQVPARDPELGPLVRALFIPEDEHDWGSADYSQVEYRIFAHYALGPGSDEIREAYRKNPKLDFHNRAAEMAQIDRFEAKTFNFAVLFGQGLDSTTRMLGRPRDEVERLLEEYHSMVPFAKRTLKRVAEVAAKRGWVKTILGRRARFDFWEPADFKLSKHVPAMRDRKAMAERVEEIIEECKASGQPVPGGGVKRAGTYKALNRIIQGSGADLLKKAMVKAYQDGLFQVLVPHLTVHDELDVSVPRTREGWEAWEELIHTMETAIEFHVPILVDGKLAENWAEAK